MTNKQEFEYFIEQMLDNAVKNFRETEQYGLLREKMSRMEAECDTILNPEDREFVTECFEIILQKNGQEEHYVYRQGLLDGVKLLKWLGILA